MSVQVCEQNVKQIDLMCGFLYQEENQQQTCVYIP